MSVLPSSVQPTQRDESYERGFLLGRLAIIRAVRDALDAGTFTPQLLEELEHVKFTR